MFQEDGGFIQRLFILDHLSFMQNVNIWLIINK